MNVHAWETVANKVAAAINTATNKKQQTTMTAIIYY
jgi:hypothetical protein